MCQIPQNLVFAGIERNNTVVVLSDAQSGLGALLDPLGEQRLV